MPLYAPLFQTQTDLGIYKHTRSSIAPGNPNVGDTWDEMSSLGLLISTWFWNGLHWLSCQIFIKEGNLNNNASVNFYYDFFPSYNIYLLDFRANFTLGLNTNTAYWDFLLNRVGATSVTLSTLSTASAVGNNWFFTNQLLNTYLDVVGTSTKALRFTSSKVGSPANLTGSLVLTHRLARIL